MRYTASPESIANANRALKHFGSFENIRKSSVVTLNGTYLYYIPKDCACGCQEYMKPFEKKAYVERGISAFITKILEKIFK